MAKTKAKTMTRSTTNGYTPRLKQLYREKILSALQKQVDYKNVWQVPRLDKIILNMGLGDAKEDANMLKSALDDLAVISGQKGVVTYARKPISNFKIRAGDPVGAKVTLRGERMYDFLDRLLSLAVPRIRDFRGLPNRSFDGRGNYSFGINEQIIFPEIDYDKIDQIRGMDITIVTTADTDEEAYELLLALGFPFRPKPQAQPSTEGATT
ncbi:50S ribosomal protein L5 [subsurface metagenome]